MGLSCRGISGANQPFTLLRDPKCLSINEGRKLLKPSKKGGKEGMNYRLPSKENPGQKGGLKVGNEKSS